jgi:hypothetical protein
MISIPIFWIVLLIVIIHSGFDHMINWGFRAVVNAHMMLEDKNVSMFLMVCAVVIQWVLTISCLYAVLF